MVIANKALTTNFSKNKLHIAVTYHPGLKISAKLSTKIYTFFIWIKKSRKYLHQSPWFLSVVPGN